MSGLEGYQFIRLGVDHEFKPFDCGDSDLNEFLLKDSQYYSAKLLAVTYLLEREDVTAAFFCVANDKITVEDVDFNNQWRRFKNKLLGKHQHYKSFPAVKVGRFAVHNSLQGNLIGTGLLDFIKGFFVTENKTGCMFITVDAYVSSIPFYKKNGFELLCPQKEASKNSLTRLMYYDLRELI